MCLQVGALGNGKIDPHLTTPWETIDIFWGQDEQKMLSSIPLPLASPHSSLQAILMWSWFLELVEHVGNAKKIRLMSGKGLGSVIGIACIY